MNPDTTVNVTLTDTTVPVQDIKTIAPKGEKAKKNKVVKKKSVKASGLNGSRYCIDIPENMATKHNVTTLRVILTESEKIRKQSGNKAQDAYIASTFKVLQAV